MVCSFFGCVNENINDDDFFCFGHRQLWRESCNNYFGVDVQAREFEIRNLLGDFRGKR